jgi:hypothetical protein
MITGLVVEGFEPRLSLVVSCRVEDRSGGNGGDSAIYGERECVGPDSRARMWKALGDKQYNKNSRPNPATRAFEVHHA